MSYKEEIIKYISEHPHCTTTECKEAVGCSIVYVRNIFSQLGHKAKRVYPTRIKYFDNSFLGEYNVFFKKRLDSKRGIFICPYDNKEFEASIRDVARGKIRSCGCLHNSNGRNNTFIDMTGWRFGKLVCEYCLPYTTEDNQAIWHCKCDCGGEKDVVGRVLRNGNVNSCGCLVSKGELAVKNVLINKAVNFIQQKSFDDCVNPETGAKLRFDFYLPDHNCCIEYDGKQHYSSGCGWNTEERFKDLKRRDRIKDQYCIDHGIVLYRISYLEYDNIDNRMEEILKEL